MTKMLISGVRPLTRAGWTGFATSMLLCSPALVAGARDAEPMEVYHQYEGTIGTKAVHAILRSTTTLEWEKTWSGSYDYEAFGQPISLFWSHTSDGSMELFETAPDKMDPTGKWQISIDGGDISGTWSSPDQKTSLPIKLHEVTPEGAVEIEVVNFSSSWNRSRETKQLGISNRLSVIQVKGSGEATQTLNQNLRSTILDRQFPVNPESKASPAAPPQLSDLEKATIATPPEELDWEFPYVEETSNLMNLVMNESDLLCVANFYYGFTGGAHGNYSYQHSTYDTRTGAKLDLPSMIKPGYEPRWTSLAAGIIRKRAGVAADAPMTEAGLLDDEFHLSDDWFLTSGGIGISYDPYEIASFADGQITIFLPWEDIQADLIADTPVDRLAKRFLARRAKDD